jgi:hypothetical protein
VYFINSLRVEDVGEERQSIRAPIEARPLAAKLGFALKVPPMQH